MFGSVPITKTFTHITKGRSTVATALGPTPITTVTPASSAPTAGQISDVQMRVRACLASPSAAPDCAALLEHNQKCSFDPTHHECAPYGLPMMAAAVTPPPAPINWRWLWIGLGAVAAIGGGIFLFKRKAA